MASTPQLLDVQARTPDIHLNLSQVGVSGVEKVIALRQNGADQLFLADFTCTVELGPDQKGAHMSRFEEVVNTAIAEVVLEETALRADTLAERIAGLVRERQQARRAEVAVSARFAEAKPAPVSGIESQEIYTLHGVAAAGTSGTRRLTGVSAQGITACPCAQEIITAGARERLESDGFSDDEITRILEAVPVATHNQRGIGTLFIGLPEGAGADVDAAALVSLVESSMSSEIYELMKRSDEAHVVEKAHRRPRFVEDCVREMISGVLTELHELRDDVFVSARQENLETIHQHNVVAERFGLLGEIRHEFASGETSIGHTSRRAWLDAAL